MLVARDLTKEFQSGTHRLAVQQHVSFSLPQGAFVAIVGPSGSGKSTLLRLLQRQYVPQQGRVLLDGHDLRGLQASSVRRQLGVVPQHPPTIHAPISRKESAYSPKYSASAGYMMRPPTCSGQPAFGLTQNFPSGTA